MMKMYMVSKTDHTTKLVLFLFLALISLQVLANSEIKIHEEIVINYPVEKASTLFAPPEIEGERKRFHKLTFTWDGPTTLIENETTFRDYRLNVTFTSPSGKIYKVPGYFAADGDAGETSAVEGNKWRCNFNAMETGTWTYIASFRNGTNIAVSFNDADGSPLAPIDGDRGTFDIAETDKTGKDFRAKGKLEYVGEHFQQWTNGEYFMKIGSNSPENLLEYGGFDDSNSTRTFPDHIADYNPGDPTWKGGEGLGIIGAINYLSGKGINSQYFVLHRKEERATPWSIPYDNYYQYDVSKMDQWQILFDHMMQKGVAAHLVFSESKIQSIFEAEFPSGDPNFSDARKLYFREVIARFGYLNAVFWNIGEENGWDREGEPFVGPEGRANTTQQQLDFASYIDNLTYYSDFITIHNGPSHDVRIFKRLQGENSIDGISMQGLYGNTVRGKGSTEQFRFESANSGKKWVVYYDEPFHYATPGVTTFRKNVIWPTFTSGGAGIENYATEGRDITMEDIRFYDEYFSQMKYAYDFYHDNDIPFYDMYNQDNLVEKGWCHGTEFNDYVIFITGSELGNTTIDLTGDYTVKWFNPRTGGPLMDGTITNVSAGDNVNIGDPPSVDNADWVALVRNTETDPIPVTGIIVSPENLNIEIGQTYKLEVEVLPGLADNKDVEWTSSDSSVVTVDAEGNILGVALGYAVVTARTIDGSFTDDAEIVVSSMSEICTADGTLIMERYDNIEGFEIIDLLNSPDYPNSPTVVSELNEFEIPSDVDDSYGVRISGFLCAPETGVYTFWIAGDDHVQLNLSPDNQFSNAVEIASHDSFTAPRDWNRFASQRSGEVQLQQGRVYYIEALLKEGILKENMAVGWRKPSDGPGNNPSEVIPASVMTSRDSGRTAVTSVDLNAPTADLRLGDTLELIETVLPLNASDKSVIWSSDNPSIVSVDQEGNILGAAIGTTVVSVTTVDGNFVAQATITVIDDSVISVTGISVTPETTNLVLDGTLVLEATIEPADATNKSVVWTSDDPSIASVDANGELTGVSHGTTIIRVTTVDGNFEALSTVTVVNNSQVNVTAIELDIVAAEIEVGQTLILQATVQPVNATNTAVIWSSEDESIISVDTNGEILGVAVGSTIITATTEEGNFVDQATITVVPIPLVNVTGVEINVDSTNLELGSSIVLDAIVEPFDASDVSVEWTSNDTSIVTVDDNGVVFGVALGSTTVSVTTIDGEFTAQSTITVIEKSEENNGFIAVTGLSLDIDDLVLLERDIEQIIATVLPENATQEYILWVPEDPSIITVDENGFVHAKKVGETMLTATTLEGGFSKTITVTVLPNNIIVHPNPTEEFINIAGIDERISVSIYNSSGVLVKTAKGGNPIYVGDLSDGNYIILLSTEDRIRFVKI